ncbi:MAG: ParB N-terminal domain-containing protein [Nitrosomonadales bacterium]
MKIGNGTHLAIEYIEISKLKHDPNNARKHPTSQIDEFKAIISEVGFITPAIIDAANVIQCGNGAVMAARELRLKTIPCVRLADHTPDQLRVLRISHNSIGEKSEWDNVILLSEINLLPIDLQPLTGFDPQTLINQLKLPEWEDVTDDGTSQEDPAPYTVDTAKQPDTGIKVPIAFELSKPIAQKARLLRDKAGFDKDWAGFFIMLIEQYEANP